MHLLLRVAAVAGSLLAIGGVAFVILKNKMDRSHQRLADFVNRLQADHKDETVHLFAFQRYLLAPSLSPYCVKLEAFLRLAKIPYCMHVVSGSPGDVSPNGAVPFVVYKGRRMADSKPIMDWLSSEFNVQMDSNLTKEQQAMSKALTATLEYSVKPAALRSMYADDKCRCFIPFAAPVLGVPLFLGPIVGAVVQRIMNKKFESSGFSSLSRQQYEAVLLKDVKAIESFLADANRPFALGQELSTTDCALYGFCLFFVRMHRLSSPSMYRTLSTRSCSDGAKSSPVLINEGLHYLASSPVINAYVDRVSALAFPDLETLLRTPGSSV